MAEATDKTVTDLFLAAELGRKPRAKERRDIVLYLERTLQINDHRDTQLAKKLGCSLKTLSNDRKRAQDILAAGITSEQAMFFMSDYLRHIDLLIVEAKLGMKQAVLGGTGHAHYVRLVGELVDSKITKLQSVGVIPKELGRLNTVQEEWHAEASKDGVLDVHRAPEEP